MIIIPRIAAGLAAWGGYTAVTRFCMRQAFAGLRVVSETRPEGNIEDLVKFSDKLRPLDSSAAEEYSHHLWGENQLDGQFYKLGKRMALCKTNDEKYGIFAKEELSEKELESVIGTKGVKRRFPTDPSKFFLCMQKLAEATPIDESMDLNGEYDIAFRTYCNHEEEWGIMCSKFGMERLVMRPVESKCIFKEDGKCEMREKGVMFGVVPLCISWFGEIVGGQVEWSSTRLKFGWKTVENPPAAEKLRVQPWKLLTLPSETDDQVVFEREGMGRLAARKAALA